MDLSVKEQKVLELLQKGGVWSKLKINEVIPDASGVTIIRALNHLLELGLIEKQGEGRGVKYQIKGRHPLLESISLEKYFQKDPDERLPEPKGFQFGIYGQLKDLFTSSERAYAKQCGLDFMKREKAYSPTLRKKEYERITIELAWKSSKIEGNTYDLLETEVLLRELKMSPGHAVEEARMLLNHKQAFEYILENRKDFKKLSLQSLREVHTLLVKDLNVPTGVRSRIVGITGTNYRPLDNRFQIQEALDQLIDTVNQEKDPLDKAFITFAMLAYIQAFEDGNKRSSRLMTNAVLVAHGYCPLSFRSVDVQIYKKATLLWYESNQLKPLKELFLDQYRFSAEHYFL